MNQLLNNSVITAIRPFRLMQQPRYQIGQAVNLGGDISSIHRRVCDTFVNIFDGIRRQSGQVSIPIHCCGAGGIQYSNQLSDVMGAFIPLAGDTDPCFQRQFRAPLGMESKDAFRKYLVIQHIVDALQLFTALLHQETGVVQFRHYFLPRTVPVIAVEYYALAPGAAGDMVARAFFDAEFIIRPDDDVNIAVTPGSGRFGLLQGALSQFVALFLIQFPLAGDNRQVNIAAVVAIATRPRAEQDDAIGRQRGADAASHLPNEIGIGQYRRLRRRCV